MTSQDDRSSLLHRGVGAVVWGAFGAVIRIVLQILAQVVLARLLGPEVYGIFAVSLTIVLFASLFSDLGLAYGLIQRPVVDETVIRFVFTWQLMLGVAFTLGLMATAAPLARLFGDPRLEPVLRLLALSCTLASVGATAGMLMRRNLDFKTLNIAVVVSYAVGFLGLGIPMALMGFGVYALVAANLTQMGLAALITYLGMRHSVRPLFAHPDWRGILGFGTTVLATNILNWVMMSLDRLVVGATMQAAAAGLYATVGNLVIAPVMTVIAVLQSALYSTSARAQEDRDRLRTALLSVLGAVALLLAPMFFAVGSTAETLILAIYGERWAGGGDVLRPIAFAMPAYLLMGMAVPTLWASGRTTWEFTLQLPLAVSWAAALYFIGKSGSLQVLSWSVCGWFYLRAAVIMAAACRALDIRFSECLRAMRAGVIVTAIVSLVATATNYASTSRPLVAELEIIAACAIALIAAFLLVRPLLSEDLLRLLDKVAQWIPMTFGQRFLRRVIAGGSGRAAN